MNNFTNNPYQGGMYANNIGGYAPSGYTQQPMQPQRLKNVLTPEEIKSLRKTVDTFSLGLTQEEILRGRCTHKDENGVETLKDNGDGTVTCTICGYTFDPLQNCTEEDIQGFVNNITDVLQTIKLLYIDMPTEAAREYFQIIPLINKIPKLFKIASDNFSRHENYNNYRYNGTPNTINLYSMLSNGTIGAGYPQYQQPYGAPMGAPMGMGMGQPAPAPAFGQQPMGMTNGFGAYGTAPQAGYQPATTGFGYTPNQTNINAQPTGTLPQGNVAYAQQAPLVAPTVQANEVPTGAQVPTAATATTDGQEVKVNTSFKS